MRTRFMLFVQSDVTSCERLARKIIKLPHTQCQSKLNATNFSPLGHVYKEASLLKALQIRLEWRR